MRVTMFIPTSVRVVLVTTHPNKQGLFPIVLRFIQNRKVHNISLRKYIPLQAWENKGGMFVKEKGEGSVKSAKALNHFLNEVLSKARKIIYLSEADNSSLTFEKLCFLGS